MPDFASLLGIWGGLQKLTSVKRTPKTFKLNMVSIFVKSAKNQITSLAIREGNVMLHVIIYSPH